MAGEYQLAQGLIKSGVESAQETEGMNEGTFARALMYELLEYNRKTRSEKDIVSELEQYIRNFEDEGQPVITRGS